MSYTALYRKFRPQTFDDVKGQDHIVTTLQNQIKAERIGHAYLFCGTRGTGKTTIAKIFAKAINCKEPVNGNPCGKCPSCQSIANGASMNVIEIDAASHNGVDSARQIVEEVTYSPVDGKYKVYIIDEAHMLTKEALNALLKTMEEPPSYAVFILATTEPHKLLITILSRCQRYDFKRISIETMMNRMKELIGIENVDVTDGALRYIAKMADGSMRDALSLLDQCIAFHFGKTLTYEMALDVLGAVDVGIFSDMLRLVLAEDVTGCITLLEKIVMQGRDLNQFVTDFAWYLRNMMLLKSSTDTNVEELLDMSGEHIVKLREEADMVDNQTIIRYIYVLSDLSNRMRYATQKRIMVEMTLIKLCRPQMETTYEALLDRMRQLEKKVEEGVTVAVQATPEAVKQVETSSVLKKREKPLPEDLEALKNKWNQLVNDADFFYKPSLKKCQLATYADNDKLVILAPDEMTFTTLNDYDVKAKLKELILSHTDKEIDFEIQLAQSGGMMGATSIEQFRGILDDIGVEYEDDDME